MNVSSSLHRALCFYCDDVNFFSAVLFTIIALCFFLLRLLKNEYSQKNGVSFEQSQILKLVRTTSIVWIIGLCCFITPIVSVQYYTILFVFFLSEKKEDKTNINHLTSLISYLCHYKPQIPSSQQSIENKQSLSF